MIQVLGTILKIFGSSHVKVYLGEGPTCKELGSYHLYHWNKKKLEKVKVTFRNHRELKSESKLPPENVGGGEKTHTEWHRNQVLLT